MLQIETTELNGTKYHETTVRGVKYTLSFCSICNEWMVQSKRLSMANAAPGCRWFADLAELEAKVKGLVGISSFVN